MNSKFSAKNLRICENAVQNCTKSRIRLMMYMNSLSKSCIELIKVKEIMQELERTTDAAEHVGKILRSLIVKYA